MISIAISAVQVLTICIMGLFAPVEISSHAGALVVESPLLEVTDQYGREKDISFHVNGIIFGAFDEHEYGHYLQQRKIGNRAYYLTVAVPSVVVNILQILSLPFGGPPDSFDYYLLPWEYDATILGNQWRTQHAR